MPVYTATATVLGGQNNYYQPSVLGAGYQQRLLTDPGSIPYIAGDLGTLAVLAITGVQTFTALTVTSTCVGSWTFIGQAGSGANPSVALYMGICRINPNTVDTVTISGSGTTGQTNVRIQQFTTLNPINTNWLVAHTGAFANFNENAFDLVSVKFGTANTTPPTQPGIYVGATGFTATSPSGQSPVIATPAPAAFVYKQDAQPANSHLSSWFLYNPVTLGATTAQFITSFQLGSGNLWNYTNSSFGATIMAQQLVIPAELSLDIAIPSGVMWLVSLISIEIVHSTFSAVATNISADIRLNQNLVRGNLPIYQGNAAYQGPPYLGLTSIDRLSVVVNNGVVGQQMAANFFYNEYNPSSIPRGLDSISNFWGQGMSQ